MGHQPNMSKWMMGLLLAQQLVRAVGDDRMRPNATGGDPMNEGLTLQSQTAPNNEEKV